MRFFEQKSDPPDVKYLQELTDEITYYGAQIILNVFHGVAANIGVPDPDRLAPRPPGRLEKGFLSGLIDIARDVRGLVGRRMKSPFEPFKIRGLNLFKKNGEPTTVQEWTSFEDQLVDYMRPYLDNAAEEIAVKGILLALASAEAEHQGHTVRDYGKKSYTQVETELYSGYIPDTMISARERYRIDRDTDKAMIDAHSNAAAFVTKTGEQVRDAIRQQVIAAHRQNKPWRELASDLYWMKDDVPEMKKFTAEILLRDWHRVAITELAYIHGTGKLAPLESQARNSLTDQTQAVYYVFHGSGRCDWCSPRQGTVVRHIPIEAVGDPSEDRLSKKGIQDPYTDIAVWQGKNNVGIPKASWRICIPVHPWCQDILSRFYPDAQEFDVRNQMIKPKEAVDFDISQYMPDEFIQAIESGKAENRLRREKQEADRKRGIHERDAEYYKDWGGRKRRRA